MNSGAIDLVLSCCNQTGAINSQLVLVCSKIKIPFHPLLFFYFSAELTAELHQHQLQQQLQQQQNGLHLQQITVADSGSRSGSQSAEEAVVVQPAVVHPAPAPAPVPSQMIMVTAAAAAAEAHHHQHQQHNPPVSREQGATTSSSSASNEHQHHLKNSFERELTATVKLTVVERQVSSNTQRSKTKGTLFLFCAFLCFYFCFSVGSVWVSVMCLQLNRCSCLHLFLLHRPPSLSCLSTFSCKPLFFLFLPTILANSFELTVVAPSSQITSWPVFPS